MQSRRWKSAWSGGPTTHCRHRRTHCTSFWCSRAAPEHAGPGCPRLRIGDHVRYAGTVARPATPIRIIPWLHGQGRVAMSPRRDGGFAGNKSFLPSKPCAVCGRTMTWRRAWAKTWDEVRYCSERCRRNRRAADAPDSSRDG
ncbi:DUF2256 domain-containing protein [Luteimonas flava]|uniref:DUF2256 domain-containing protein n=1 Tax=Luteimonas flava TaxID=3115822 RepID=UPI003CCE1C5C